MICILRRIKPADLLELKFMCSEIILCKGMSLKLFGIVLGIVIILFVMSSLGCQLMQPRIAMGLMAKNWVSTWVASPQLSPDQVFSDQTLRQIVHTSLGGDLVRVRLSNTFGVQPITLGEVHIALRSKGPAIIPGSDRILTFSGKPAITIPPGTIILSDPTKLHIHPLTDIAISIYLPYPSDATTIHPLALQDNYISARGNFAGSAIIRPVNTIQNWIFLTGVEVTSSKKAIIALGDSITDGYQSTANGNYRWPNILADRLVTNAKKHLHMAVLDAGISGNRILNDCVGPSALARFDRDVLAQPSIAYLILLEGINDIAPPSICTTPGIVNAVDITTGLHQLIERAHEHGIRVFVGTLLPFKGSTAYTSTFPQGEQKREQVNHWIRTSGASDGVIDFDRIMQDPYHPKRLLPLYASSDHIHPNDDGYKVMGKSIRLSLFLHNN
jgi:lysophospholipase L1-like esterase